jgi:hypothetical protein
MHDRELLLEQVREIRPNLIVACGTIDTLLWVLEPRHDPSKPPMEPIFDEERAAWIIPWRHPTRADNRSSYERLKIIAASPLENLTGHPVNVSPPDLAALASTPEPAEDAREVEEAQAASDPSPII